ncbi:MAG: response regulator transcription factor [Leptolyngbyaceae cyanobacterium MO_188.B28]|nr:response regulator transcription factor [Leptolyngbyaceae cyanobacterium MO_188.B28]
MASSSKTVLLDAPTLVSHQPISVLLVDDDPRFRQGLRTLLTFYNSIGSEKFSLVGEAATADQALHLVHTQRPMLVLLDLEMPAGDGIEVLKRLSDAPYSSKVLVLSAHHEDEWVFRAMQAGANGYLCKHNLSGQLSDAMETLLRGQVYLSSETLTSFFRLFRFYAGRSLEAARKFKLTQREQEVLHWLVQGASNEEIASNLYITVATVKAHLTAIFQKLSVASRTQAIIKALKLGLISGMQQP